MLASFPVKIKLTTKSMAETKTAPVAPLATKEELKKHLDNEVIVALANAGKSPNPFLWVRNNVDPLQELLKTTPTVTKEFADKVFALRYKSAEPAVAAPTAKSA